MENRLLLLVPRRAKEDCICLCFFFLNNQSIVYIR